MSGEILAVVSGSFKYKPEIDKTIETLEQTGIRVLEPAKGWLILPKFDLAERLKYGQIRPLPTEEKLTTREIEGRFLRALKKANLVYIMNESGYVGNSTALELGYAIGLRRAVYAHQRLDFDVLEIDDVSEREFLARTVTVLPPEKVACHYQEIRENMQ